MDLLKMNRDNQGMLLVDRVQTSGSKSLGLSDSPGEGLEGRSGDPSPSLYCAPKQLEASGLSRTVDPERQAKGPSGAGRTPNRKKAIDTA